MNAIKFFFAIVFFCSFNLISQAQTQQDLNNYDNKVITVSDLDVAQTQTKMTLKNQTKTAEQLSGINASNTSINNISKISTSTYVFNFNHKQFFKPVIRKSAYC